MNGYERIAAMLDGQPVDRPPVMPITMMFAGDLIGVPYGKYATDHTVLVDAQIKTAEMFDFDYVSCISDPGREAADCGAVVEIFDDQPPSIDESQARLADKSQLASLEIPNPLEPGSRMADRVAAAKLFHERVGGERYIEGWIEGPCAEGADLRGINTLMLDFYDDPDFVREIFEFTVAMGVKFAKAQHEAGVDIIGVGDAAASLVGPDLYREFVFPYEKKLVDALHEIGTRVRLHICGNITGVLEEIGQLGVDMIDIDSMVPLTECRAKMGDSIVLAGNLDPVQELRAGTEASVLEAVGRCHQESGDRFIIAAGCEVPRDTPHENVRAMVDYSKQHPTTG